MVLSPAEKQSRYRERQKAQKLQEERKASEKINEIFSRPFFEFLNDHGDLATFDMAFDGMGLDAPQFSDDSGPKSFTGAFEADFADDLDDSPFAGMTGSLGRAEYMVEVLIDAAVSMSGIINEYKREQITARLNEIEQADLADPATRKRAMGEVVRLNKLLERLSKPVRWNFPQWKLKGE